MKKRKREIELMKLALREKQLEFEYSLNGINYQEMRRNILEGAQRILGKTIPIPRLTLLDSLPPEQSN